MSRLLIRTSFIILLFGISISGQNKEFNFHVTGIGVLPTGPFGKSIGNPIEVTRRHGFDYGNDIGLAKMGYGIGVELNLPVLYLGLAWQFGTKLLFNSTDNSDITTAFNNDPKIVDNLKFETGNWINIPILSGFSYGINIISEFNLYFHVQAGINFSDQAYRKAFYKNVLVEEVKYNTQVDFALEGGITVDFAEFYSLSIRYINLNSPRYEGKRYLNELVFPDMSTRNYSIAAEEKSVEMILFTIGLKI